MFVKIMRHDEVSTPSEEHAHFISSLSTKIYDCKRVFVNPWVKEGNTKYFTLVMEGQDNVSITIHEGDKAAVYLMNNEGKTIDCLHNTLN